MSSKNTIFETFCLVSLQCMCSFAMFQYLLDKNTPTFAHHDKILQSQLNELISTYFAGPLSFTQDEFWQNLSMLVFNWESLHKAMLAIAVFLSMKSVAANLKLSNDFDNVGRAVNSTLAGMLMIFWFVIAVYLHHFGQSTLIIVDKQHQCHVLLLIWFHYTTFVLLQNMLDKNIKTRDEANENKQE